MSELRRKVLRLAHNNSPLREHLLPLLRTAGGDIKVNEIEFSSGQDPDLGYDDDFATTVTVEFSVSGDTLASLCGKQKRVLERYLKKLKPKQAITHLLDHRSKGYKKVLNTLQKEVGKWVKQWSLYDADDIISYDVSIQSRDIEYANNTNFFEAKISPQWGMIEFTAELEVFGTNLPET